MLTYDDALGSQLDHAVPVLDAAGFKATFFLANLKPADVSRWRAVGAEGHELANHTVFYACPAAVFPTDPRYTSEAYTPASIRREIEQQNTLLTALNGKPPHGFASPCGQTPVGAVDYIEALRAANLVTYVRGIYTSPDDLRADVNRMDPMHVGSGMSLHFCRSAIAAPRRHQHRGAAFPSRSCQSADPSWSPR